MENTGDSRYWLAAKITGIWGLVGVTSWSEAASFMAFCLTCWIFGRHVWRDAIRPAFERFGWVKSLTPAETIVDAIQDAGDGI